MPSQPDMANLDLSPSPISEPEVEDRSLQLPVHGSTVTAEDLRVRMVLACDFDGALHIDASRVETVGQAVLQLLVAARAEAREAGHDFEIVNPSAAFVERVQACGLAEAVGLSEEEFPS
ncbi:STAS domain-containing protein [Novosphingobium lindaniclasticum]